jgi:small subunit ribosomal protein S18
MARNNQRGTTTRRAPKDLGRRVKKKPCALCRDKTEWVDYKDVPMLRKYMSDRGKIRSRRVTGNCAQHQRALAQAIKTARELILLPYTQRTVTERPGGRGGGRDRGERGERGERAERTLSDTIGADAPRDRDASLEIISDVEAFDRSTTSNGDGPTVGAVADADDGVDTVDAADTDGAADTDDTDDTDGAAAGASVSASDEGGER